MLTGGLLDMDSFYSDRSVLVTGGLGFIGSNLAWRLVQMGANVVIVDSMIPGHGATMENIQGLEDDIVVVLSDIREADQMRELVRGQELIFSLAGQVSHSESMVDPATDLSINCLGHLSLLECCRLEKLTPKIIYPSTRQVFGKPNYLPVDELHPLSPVDFNGIHKLAAEYYYSLYHDVFGIPSVCLRLTNTYGPRMDIDNSRKGFIGVFIRKALSGDIIDIFGSGQQQRDLNYVEDVVDALLLSGSNDQVNGKIFNLGHPGPVTLLEIVSMLDNILGCEYRIIDFPPDAAAIDIGDYCGDYQKFNLVTGWEPKVAVEEGLRRTVEWYLEKDRG